MSNVYSGITKPRGSLPLLNQPIKIIDDTKTTETKKQTFYFNFVYQKWSKDRSTMLKRCEEKKITFIEAQRKLLTENYKDIPELTEFLKFNENLADKIHGHFDCHLDGNLICHMKCSGISLPEVRNSTPNTKISMAETINVEVKWNPDSLYERIEHWVLETTKFTRIARLLNVAKDKSPVSFSFMSHDMSNTFSTSASACRTATLREMRACLASWSDSLLS